MLATAGTISLENSIVATNTVGGGATALELRQSANVSSLGHNIDDGAGCGSPRQATCPNTDPQFLSANPQSQSVFIADWGGNTGQLRAAGNQPRCRRVPAGSPGCSGTDQRDIARPQGSGCDIGADELD